MMRELGLKNPKITKKITKETQNLLDGLLERDQHKRLSIEQVLQHSSMRFHKDEFEKPICEEDLTILVTNYMMNKNINPLEELPEIITKITEKAYKKDVSIKNSNQQSVSSITANSGNKKKDPKKQYGFYGFSKNKFDLRNSTPEHMRSWHLKGKDSGQRRFTGGCIGDFKKQLCAEKKNVEKNPQISFGYYMDFSVETKKCKPNVINHQTKKTIFNKFKTEKRHTIKSEQNVEIPIVVENENIEAQRVRIDSKSIQDFLSKHKNNSNNTSNKDSQSNYDSAILTEEKQSSNENITTKISKFEKNSIIIVPQTPEKEKKPKVKKMIDKDSKIGQFVKNYEKQPISIEEIRVPLSKGARNSPDIVFRKVSVSKKQEKTNIPISKLNFSNYLNVRFDPIDNFKTFENIYQSFDRRDVIVEPEPSVDLIQQLKLDLPKTNLQSIFYPELCSSKRKKVFENDILPEKNDFREKNPISVFNNNANIKKTIPRNYNKSVEKVAASGIRYTVYKQPSELSHRKTQKPQESYFLYDEKNDLVFRKLEIKAKNEKVPEVKVFQTFSDCNQPRVSTKIRIEN